MADHDHEAEIAVLQERSRITAESIASIKSDIQEIRIAIVGNGKWGIKTHIMFLYMLLVAVAVVAVPAQVLEIIRTIRGLMP